MKPLYFTVAALFSLSVLLGQGSYEAPDPDALEQIYVERYYISDANDACDEDGGSLAEGSVTYRVYADLKPDYILETVYGNVLNGIPHPLTVSTTTEFFNNEDRGETQGGEFQLSHVNDNTVALDSYLAFGYSVKGFYALPKVLDTDGSLLGGSANDGGSCAIATGLIANEDPLACTSVTEIDGMLPLDTVTFLTIGLGNTSGATSNSLHMFDDQNSPDDMYVDNGAWAALGGLGGVTNENLVLIGQFTTDGTLTFGLNMRVGIPDGLQCSSPDCATFIDYFAELTTADTMGLPQPEIDRMLSIPSLTFDSSDDELDCNPIFVAGCTDPAACNYSEAANMDDGSCQILQAADISTSSATEVCSGDGVPALFDVVVMDGEGPTSTLVLIDSDLFIVSILDGTSVDLEGEAVGAFSVAHIFYDEIGLGGSLIGMNLDELNNCSVSSNAIAVTINGGGCTNPEAANYDEEACFDDGTCVTSIEEQRLADALTIYPNPANSELFITVGTTIDSPLTVTTLDLRGEVVRSKRQYKPGAAYDISTLSPGTYIIHVASDSATVNLRLVKH